MVKYINNLAVSYDIFGTGPVIILFHGWVVTKESLLILAEKLKNHFTVILIDIPGFGESSSIDIKIDFDNLLDHLDTFFESINVKEFYLFGNSGGGIMCLEYFKKYPEKTLGIFLRNTPLSKNFIIKPFSNRFILNILDNLSRIKTIRNILAIIIKSRLSNILKQYKDYIIEDKYITTIDSILENFKSFDKKIARDMIFHMLKYEYDINRQSQTIPVVYFSSNDSLFKKDFKFDFTRHNIDFVKTGGKNHSIFYDNINLICEKIISIEQINKSK